jgi:hypothetical protein
MTKRQGNPTQGDIARRLGIDVSAVNKILRSAPGPAFSRETTRKVWETAKQVGYDLQRLRHQHHRGDERRFGAASVDLLIYAQDGTIVDHGRARLTEISRSGARLDQVRLPKAALPLNGFSIGIRLNPHLGAEEIRGRLARAFTFRGGNSLAIHFKVRISPAWLDALDGFKT